ncbi:MAG: futalosine hydrolase [Desulfobulbaceae bacterium]|nr:futalosine hydrolase [Desulfobulbaceae bacterium]
MFLMVAATSFELDALLSAGTESASWLPLLSGVGPVEATFRLTNSLARLPSMPQGVINFGLAGAFPGVGLELLDLCLAEGEVLGDLGIVYPDRVEPLPKSFAPRREFDCDPALLATATKSLAVAGLFCRRGRFVTLSGVSGTKVRAESLRDSWQAICENMEGAALARVCQEFGVPFLELRCISNLALDRAEQLWQAGAAAQRCGQAAAILLEGLSCGR